MKKVGEHCSAINWRLFGPGFHISQGRVLGWTACHLGLSVRMNDDCFIRWEATRHASILPLALLKINYICFQINVYWSLSLPTFLLLWPTPPIFLLHLWLLLLVCDPLKLARIICVILDVGLSHRSLVGSAVGAQWKAVKAVLPKTCQWPTSYWQ